MIKLLTFLFCFSILAEPYSPFPKYRQKAWPNSDMVHINPPQLLWPADGRSSHYQVELSRSEGFESIEIQSKKLNYACFSPHKKLAQGKWFWRLKHEDGRISGPYNFEIINQELFETPYYAEFLAGIPKSHPRFLTSPQGVKAVREKINGTRLQKELITKADEFVLAKIPDQSAMEVSAPGMKKHEIHRLMINQAKGYLGRRMMQSSYLSAAYLLTSDIKYADKAIENALFVADLDSKYQHLNDFTESMCLNTLLMVFDNCYDRMSEKQKVKTLKKIEVFTDKYYSHMQNNLETRIFDNHAWQKTFNTLFKSALISKGHIPTADQWLEYCYEVWCARAPATGFNFDGAWVNGSGYFTANIVTLIQMPTILSRYTKKNFFAHPWFKKAPYGLMMTWPAKSYSNGFGDGHGSPTNPRWKQAILVKALASANQDPEAAWFYEQMQNDPRCNKELHAKFNTKHPLDSEFIEWFSVVENNDLPSLRAPQNLSAAQFPWTGYVSMHSDYKNVDNNIFVSFRSSLFGSGSHTTCNQNAFNIIAGGEPLFLSAGHYTSFSDRHNLLQYRHTRGANSILVDGLGQSIGDHSYGKILHFEENDLYTYTIGDASAAYNGTITDPMWHKKMKEAGVEASKENGYGDSAVKKFVRHIVKLKPNYIVIFDELEAEKEVSWTWMLHSPQEMNLKETGLMASNDKFKALVQVHNNDILSEEIKTKFYEPAVNWTKRKVNGQLVDYKDQWHYEANTKKVNKSNFLAFIQVVSQESTFAELNQTSNGFKIADWEIKVSSEQGLKVYKNGKLTMSSKKTQNNEEMIVGAAK